MSNSTYLITGVAGFLGSNLAHRLLSEGHSVVGIDNLSMGHISNIQSILDHTNFDFLQADARDPTAFERVDSSVSQAVHLAAFKIPRYGKALDTLQINYHCTENVLEFSRQRDIKCVLASTSDVYGRNPSLPFSEASSDSVIGSSLSPRWAYAVSKLFDEHLALAYQDAYGFPVVLLRFFGAYGPRQPLSWWGGPPPVFIDAVLHDKSIPIHGDGQQTRSFTYVDDTIDGICAAMTSPRADGQVINLGNNEEVTILELARRIKQASGTPGDLRYELVPYASFSGKKYEDVMRRVPDTTLAKELLGVQARVALDDGLARTIAWQIRATADRQFGTQAPSVA